MDIRPLHPLRTANDYDAALAEIERLMQVDAALGTPEGDRLDALATLVQAWEAHHHPITTPHCVNMPTA